MVHPPANQSLLTLLFSELMRVNVVLTFGNLKWKMASVGEVMDTL